jgi:hypothetical protein
MPLVLAPRSLPDLASAVEARRGRLCPLVVFEEEAEAMDGEPPGPVAALEDGSADADGQW